MFDPAHAFQAQYSQQSSAKLKEAISANYCVDERAYLSKLLPFAKPEGNELSGALSISQSMISSLRANRHSVNVMDKLLLEYSLDAEEGVILMCLAEALLRIPDQNTADALIRDKLSIGDWVKHSGHSDSLFVNAATWGLMLGKKYVVADSKPDLSQWDGLVKRLGDRLVRGALQQAMALMGEHFVLGQTIDEALAKGKGAVAEGNCCSYDMLGEAALSQEDADLYLESYKLAINKIGEANLAKEGDKHSISIKLSALHPRFEERQRQRVLDELYTRVLALVELAKRENVAVTIDAEEQDRLELYLDLFEKLFLSLDWGELGVVVQAYSKRALPTLLWLNALAREKRSTIPIRLVKGAYWDSEVKLAQQQGIESYPVFTVKEATDLSYLVCAHFLMGAANQYLLPQFASHNVNTIACIRMLAARYQRPASDYEFQRLHGMGEALHELNASQVHARVRAYAPVGSHQQLLPYLVRRLLENGANSSFVHNLFDETVSEKGLVAHPYSEMINIMGVGRDKTIALDTALIAPPSALYMPERLNSAGLNLNIADQRRSFLDSLKPHFKTHYVASSLLAIHPGQSAERVENKRARNKVENAIQRKQIIGELELFQAEYLEDVFDQAQEAFESWRSKPPHERAACLNRMSELLEQHRSQLVSLCLTEAGKTLQDAIEEVREAVDFCRYYASEAERLFSKKVRFKGPVGEDNYLTYAGRGVFVCISPWNFPVAIFNGQIAAALVSGNTVVAKPAESSSLLAHLCTKLWYQAGIPKGVLQLVLARSSDLGDELTNNENIAGVAFTGSTAVAKRINYNLANRAGPIVPFIAETGGQNAMIVDSTALAEQVVKDIIHSAFNSAGQRCSALRVLYVQDDVADRIIRLLTGAMAELSIAQPYEISCDIGPVIDRQAKQKLEAHIAEMTAKGKLIFSCELPPSLNEENYVAPCAFEIEALDELKEENFGPILHVVRFASHDIDRVIDQLNDCPFGLTLGIHSRNRSLVAHIVEHVHVGNIYINRNQVGAVVGVQPFGGEKLSGTGPKAGGPNYLQRFVTEHTYCENTAAMGGNPDLLSR